MIKLNSLIKGKSNKNTVIGIEQEEITLDILHQLIPIRALSDEKLKSFAMGHKSEVVAKGQSLFQINDYVESTIYLLKGTVVLTDSNGKTVEIASTGAKAKFPLSSGIRHAMTAVAKTDVSLLKVSQKIMLVHSENNFKSEFTIPAELQGSSLLQSFIQLYNDEELEIPTLPNIALKLRKAMQKEIGIEDAVKIIQLDPVISGKLIDVANCPLYVSVTPVKSCFEAVKRIGLNGTRSLVISLSIKNLFKSKSGNIIKLLKTYWTNALYLSSLSYVLASISKQKNPEEALLAGLVCDIGVLPFLSFIENLPDEYFNEDEVNQIMPVVKGIVGSSILKEWGFDDDFVQVPLYSDDWFHYSVNSLTYTDIVILSRLHSMIGKKQAAGLPIITSIPAAGKLKNIALSPENSLDILHDAKDNIQEAFAIFSS